MSSDLPVVVAKKNVSKVEEKKDKIEVFKRPLSPPQSVLNKKRKVLSEDKFAEALEKIIQRECFPDLEKLRAQNAYLDAVANNDLQMMRELHSKYSGGRNTPSVNSIANDTPSTFETPSSIALSVLRKPGDTERDTPVVPGGTETAPRGNLLDDNSDAQSVISSTSTRSGGKKPHHLGLNEFLNTYTSEDDQSFQDIIEEGLRKHKIKYAWLYKDESDESKQVRLSITLPSAEDQQSIEYQRPNQIDMWTYKNKNPIMYIPEGVPFTKAELADMARKKIEVEFKNTRFIKAPFKDEQKAETPSSVSTPSNLSTPSTKPLNLIRGAPNGKFGIDGKEVSSSDTPMVNGFKLVRTPSPTPGAEDTPFLTWGEIEGTPFRLDAGDTPLASSVGGTPYRMLATSHREKLALELADKVSQRYRDKKQKTIEVAKSYLNSPTPRPKTSSERMLSMSPAAQRFARNLLKKSDPGTPRTPRL